MATFTCEGTGDVLQWTIGGNSLTDPSNQDREISVTTDKISVGVWSSVLPINDGVYVGCIVIIFNSQNFLKKGATLTVKG